MLTYKYTYIINCIFKYNYTYICKYKYKYNSEYKCKYTYTYEITLHQHLSLQNEEWPNLKYRTNWEFGSQDYHSQGIKYSR